MVLETLAAALCAVAALLVFRSVRYVRFRRGWQDGIEAAMEEIGEGVNALVGRGGGPEELPMTRTEWPGGVYGEGFRSGYARAFSGMWSHVRTARQCAERKIHVPTFVPASSSRQRSLCRLLAFHHTTRRQFSRWANHDARETSCFNLGGFFLVTLKPNDQTVYMTRLDSYGQDDNPYHPFALPGLRRRARR